METLVGSLIAVVVAQFSLLWYRIGRLEGRIRDLNNNLHSEKGKGKGGK